MSEHPDRRSVSAEVQEMREAILTLTLNQASYAAIQLEHKRLLEVLIEDRHENTKYKARVGGIVIGTMFAVSAVWSLILFAADFFKGH
jgi:hypothetical protein